MQPDSGGGGQGWGHVGQILTGLAGLVVAVTGLVVGLNAAGIIGGDDDPVDVAAPSATSVPETPEAATAVPETPSAVGDPATPTAVTETPPVQPDPGVPVIARIDASGLAGNTFGFFTDQGFLITWMLDVDDPGDIEIHWSVGGQSFTARGAIVARGRSSDATLLELVGSTEAPRSGVRYRNAGTMAVGETISLYLGPQQQNPGTVNEVNATKEITQIDSSRTFHNLLVTTKVTATGQTGGPIVDDDLNVVAISFASSQVESISIAIETVQVDFPQAF